jgi:Fur family ferric uptake transcriptional regulator
MKMKVKVNKVDEFREFYKCELRRGMKSSDKRALIVRYFIKEDRHFTVEQLYDAIKKINPRISYSTVYRTLKVLVDCGLAAVHHFGKDEASFEPIHKEEHHDHLVCIKCGRIIEFTHEGIEKFQRDVAKRHKFLVSSHELQIFGLCKSCQQKRRKK